MSQETLTRRVFLGGVAALAVDTLACGIFEKSLKDSVLSFTWQDLENEGKLKGLVERLASSYTSFTETPRLKKGELIANTTLYQKSQDYSKNSPVSTLQEHNWGQADFKNKTVHVDLEELQKLGRQYRQQAGSVLLDALWHEWGHLDIMENNSGSLINRPDLAYFYSPVSKTNEAYKFYRGGRVYTDTYFGFLRWDEVLNETINLRRMAEQAGLSGGFTTGDYVQTGTDFFPDFTVSVGINLNKLYELYSTSDWEGLARIIGENLPGVGSDLEKGRNLFLAVNYGDRRALANTGVFTKITSTKYSPRR